MPMSGEPAAGSTQSWMLPVFVVSMQFNSRNNPYLCTRFCIKSGYISPPTGLKEIVGSGGKEMRVRMFNSLKINDYGNQED